MKSARATNVVAGVGLILGVWILFIQDKANAAPKPPAPPPNSGGGGGGGWWGEEEESEGPTRPPSGVPEEEPGGIGSLPPVVFPMEPTIPTEPPRPRATPKTVTLTALHRYRLVVDVLAVNSLKDVATRLLPKLGFAGVDLEDTADVKRNGIDVTRATLLANVLTTQVYELERENGFAGIGSLWLVSAKEVPWQQ